MAVAQLLVLVDVLQGLDGALVDLLKVLQCAFDNLLHVLFGSFGLKCKSMLLRVVINIV